MARFVRLTLKSGNGVETFVSADDVRRIEGCDGGSKVYFSGIAGGTLAEVSEAPTEVVGLLEEAIATAGSPLALDVSLDKARALHRVWRALNDGDCPACHRHFQATEMHRSGGIGCPSCGFKVMDSEIDEIEELFAPAMDAAVAIFRQWRAER